jgi:hypothetical protein
MVKIFPIQETKMRKTLADQVKNMFVASLLALWVGTLHSNVNVPKERGSWIIWLIASIGIFIWIIVQRNRIRWPKLKWIFPLIAVGFMWLLYFISGISFPSIVLTIIGICLVAWTLFLLVLLVLVLYTNLLHQFINKVVDWNGSFTFPITFLVLMTSVVLGWTRLRDTGINEWSMNLLLILGILVIIVVWLTLIQRDTNNR